MEKSKIESYLGFSVRAGKIVYGVEMISRKTKGVKLLIIDGNIGANSLKEMVKAQTVLRCPLLQTEKGLLGEWLHKPAVKAVALTDESLSKAILAAMDEEKMKLYSGGNN